MDNELEGLLEQARSVKASPEEIAESDLRMAVFNGVISDNRVTVDALKAVQAVETARRAPRVPA